MRASLAARRAARARRASWLHGAVGTSQWRASLTGKGSHRLAQMVEEAPRKVEFMFIPFVKKKFKARRQADALISFDAREEKRAAPAKREREREREREQQICLS